MPTIKSIPVDDTVRKATDELAESMFDELNLINVRPPEMGEGMDIAPEFLDAVHFLEKEKRLLRPDKNISPVAGMELWYENNESKIMFYTEDDITEKEYRQQLTGYYEQCDISKQTPAEGMFIKSDPDKIEEIGITRFRLNKHYYYPIANPDSETDELDEDPYKRLLNEIDTKDDTRIMLQILYKPAPYGWSKHQKESLEDRATKVQKKGGFEVKYWGLSVKSVEETGIWDSTAADMLSRVGLPAFFVNVRLAIICSGKTQEQAKQKVKSRSQKILNTIDHLYKTKADQQFVPKQYKTNTEKKLKKELVDMVERNTVHMEIPKRTDKFVYSKIKRNYDTCVLTNRELAALVHLPSSDEITSGSLQFVSSVVDGQVPPDAEEFTPAQKEKIKKIQEEQGSVDLSEIFDDDNEDDENI